MILFFTRAKPTGGRRIVANLPSFYYLYTKARIQYVRDWDASNKRSYFTLGRA